LRSLDLLPIECLEDAFVGANIVFILNNHPDYAAIPIETITTLMARPSIVYDCWNNFTDQPIQLPAGVRYAAIGSHRNPIIGSEQGSKRADQ